MRATPCCWRPPTALASHDFVTVLTQPLAHRANENGLHQALLTDGFGQFVERGFVHVAARLVFTRLHRVTREHGQLPCWVFVQLGVVRFVDCVHAV